MTQAPRIEGDKVTFYWEGSTSAQLIGDFNGWGTEPPLPMVRDGAGWSVTLTFPRDSYLRYAFLVEGKRVADPLNPPAIFDGIGGYSSEFRMPEAPDTPLAHRKRTVPRGTVTRHEVNGWHLVMGGKRTIHLYQPPVSEPVPLLVVLDGRNYLQQGRLPVIVDNLIAQQRMRPVALAMIESHPVGRAVEYACSDATAAFIVHHVLPFAAQQLRLVEIETSPGAFGMMGASMGGLMSFYMAMRAPHIFGSVLCQSGAFGAHVPALRLYYNSVLDDLIRYAPVPEVRLWLDVGRYEWFLEPNRAMAALLRERGYAFNYREHNSGHNYPSWRNSFWQGLETLFSPASGSQAPGT